MLFLALMTLCRKIYFSDKIHLLKCLDVLEEMDLNTLILLRNVESLADYTDKHSLGSDIDLNQTRVFEFD